MVLEKILESPLDCKEIKPFHPKGDQSWVFTGRTDVEAETPVLWPPDAESWLIWKDPDAGKDWGQEEKRMTEDEMVGWHHQHNGHGFVWTPGVGDGQGGLACCGSWGRKELDTTEWLNWTELFYYFFLSFAQTAQNEILDLISLVRDQTHAPCIGSTVLCSGPPGKSLCSLLFPLSSSFLISNSELSG